MKRPNRNRWRPLIRVAVLLGLVVQPATGQKRSDRPPVPKVPFATSEQSLVGLKSVNLKTYLPHAYVDTLRLRNHIELRLRPA